MCKITLSLLKSFYRESVAPNVLPFILVRHVVVSNSQVKRPIGERIADPNVLPFIHVTLSFMSNMSRLLHTGFPWNLLSIMLNTLLAF